MRTLGIDYGDSRIGLAVSDLLDLTAQPLKVITVNNGWKNAVPQIADVIKEYMVDKIVIGYPLNLDGTAGERCKVTERFIEVLLNVVGDIRIIKWDERFTTKQAEFVVKKDKKGKGSNDMVSAALILQSYLDFYTKKP